MESKTKVLGHPLHPQMINFPLGLLTWATVADILYLLTRNNRFATLSYWNLVGGVLGGLAAAPVGFIDWLHIPHGTRARRIGLLHGGGNLVVVSLFGTSLWLRRNSREHIPNTAALALAMAGLGLISITGWLGGELVDPLGVGGDGGAHFD